MSTPTPKPCRCDAPNPACLRAGGRPTLGRLWELCRGVNCTAKLSEAYRRLWDGMPPATTRPCKHLGPATGETVECVGCNQRLQIPLMACARHGRCTPGRVILGVASCVHCPDQEPG